jgi:hypothetical protein
MSPKMHPVKFFSANAALPPDSNLGICYLFLVIVCRIQILSAAGFSLLAAGQKPVTRSQRPEH